MATSLFKNARFLQVLKNIQQKRYSSGYGHGHHQTRRELAIENRATYDFLPTPKGSWQELNNKRQAANNTALVAGLVLFVASCVLTRNIWDDVLFGPPYELVRKDFPGSKFVD